MSGTPGGSGGTGARWPIIITEWALTSYLAMKRPPAVFTDAEYWGTIRPDVELLRDGVPSPHAKFSNSKFWGPAKLGSTTVPHGFKMKWHQIGPGLVQIRLPVNVGTNVMYLCEAYVKSNPVQERRMLLRFMTHMNLIAQGKFTRRGVL
jgi:hypothetical protein